MAIFNYVGRNEEGKRVAGHLDAKNLDDVVRFLKERGIAPININELKDQARDISSFQFHLFGTVKKQEVMIFCEQMATLMNAGVPVVNAVQQLGRSTKTHAFANALSKIADGIDSGQSLSTTLRAYPDIFPPIFISVIEVGETTGNLDEAFKQLGKFLETEIINRRRLVAAIRYPLIVLTALVIAILMMNIFVIPKFADMFVRFGQTLPLPTRFLIGFSNILMNYWGLIIVAIVAIFFAIRFSLKIPNVRYSWDKYLLKIPIFGDLQKRVILSQFSWTFGLILHSGVPVIRGITLMAKGTANAYLANKILAMRDGIESGESFSQVASVSKLFSPSALQMFSVGEETGKLDDMLTKVAEYYERDVDYDIKRLNDLLEPILLGSVGAVVLLVALGVYLPMWDMIKFAKF